MRLSGVSGGTSSSRRRDTTPGPFGDVAHLTRLLEWIEEYGIDNAVQRFHEESIGQMGYGRPSEDPERRSYAFAGLVALWQGTLSKDLWPAELGARLPPRPNKRLMAQALAAARILASRVLTPDAELRLIWEDASDRGAELRRWVQSLTAALAA